jgi:hypothetical protein
LDELDGGEPDGGELDKAGTQNIGSTMSQLSMAWEPCRRSKESGTISEESLTTTQFVKAIPDGESRGTVELGNGRSVDGDETEWSLHLCR